MSGLSRSAHAEYGDVVAPHDSSTTESQTSLLNGRLLLPSETLVERHSENMSDMVFSIGSKPEPLAYVYADSIVKFPDVDRQRRHVNPEAMREPYHRWRKMIPKHTIRFSPYSDNGASQSFAELGSGGELGAPQGHMPYSVSMDTLGPAHAFHALKIPMYSPATEPVKYQIRGLSHSAQTSMLRKPHKAVPWKGVRGDYEKRSTPFPLAHPFYYPHLATSEYGRASEIDTDGSNSCLLQHRMNSSVFTNTETGKGNIQSSVADSSGGESNEPSVVSFISDVLLDLLHEVVRRAYRGIDLPTKCELEVHGDVYEIVPVDEEGDVDITVWVCCAFGVGAEEVGGDDRRIGLDDR
ncbi:hypothetical protein JOM56_010367 [Amanita muscaria]